MTIDNDEDGLAGQRMIAYLKRRGPDDWHFVGAMLNWDAAMEVIQWILGQRTCDKATVALMFWGTSPDHYLRFPNREALMATEPYNVEGFDLAKTVLDRWNSGFYTRTSIAYTPEPRDVLARYRRAEAQYRASGLPWQVNDDIGSVRQGLDLSSHAEYRKRYSEELRRLLYALATDIPHPDRMHGSRGTVLGRIKGFFGLD